MLIKKPIFWGVTPYRPVMNETSIPVFGLRQRRRPRWIWATTFHLLTVVWTRNLGIKGHWSIINRESVVQLSNWRIVKYYSAVLVLMEESSEPRPSECDEVSMTPCTFTCRYNEVVSHPPAFIRSANGVKQINTANYEVILFHLRHLSQTSYVKTWCNHYTTDVL